MVDLVYGHGTQSNVEKEYYIIDKRIISYRKQCNNYEDFKELMNERFIISNEDVLKKVYWENVELHRDRIIDGLAKISKTMEKFNIMALDLLNEDHDINAIWRKSRIKNNYF